VALLAPPTFASVALVGWFDRRAKDAHQRLLADARHIVERFQIPGTASFDLASLPPEFHWALRPRLETVLWHVENTTEIELGDAKYMRELREELGFVHLLSSGNVSLETQRNFRTHCFEAAVEGLAKMVEQPGGLR
jgi:hypothetical protein